MGRRSWWVGAMLAAVALAVPAGAQAQATAGDAVTGQGTATGFGSFVIDAHSGPSGENPTGSASFDVGQTVLDATVFCLVVDGNTARLTVSLSPTGSPFSGSIRLEVVDNAGLGVPDTISGLVQLRGDPRDCSPLPPGTTVLPLLTGDLVVVDASPLPTSKEQCKKGGWRAFGGFKNQGDCVSSVAARRPAP